MKELTVQDALNNIAVVVSDAKMTGPEHEALKKSIVIITGRCNTATKFEKAAIEAAKLAEANKPAEEKKG